MRRPITNAASWDEQETMLPNELPPWFARSLAWLLIALFLTALLAAILVRVPETVLSRFILVAEGGADPIESPRNAVLEQVLMRVGQEVKKGERLVVMRVDEVREWRTETDSREQSLRSLRERSTKLEEAHLSSLRIKESEIDQAQREVSFREKYLGTMRDITGRLEKLAGTGFISEFDLASQRLALAQSEKDLEVARRSLAQRRLERDGLEMERTRQRIEEKSATNDLSIRISALNQPLASSPDGLLEIRAPYDAVVIGVTKQNAGSVVAPGEQLGQLSPIAGRLQARLQLPESGLPQLEAKQRVRLFFDAFPYQRFGAVSGSVDWISPAAVTGSEGSDFVALASLDQQEIRNGKSSYPLRAGMKGQARITVGRRALIEFAFQPLRQLRENLRQ